MDNIQMNNPLISVIMSAYNAENFIAETISSILHQTFKNFEFIIVNDASNDKTKEIITSFCDTRIKYIENKINIGLTKSLINAWKKSTGKYIARIDADDISVPQRFEKQKNVLENDPSLSLCGSWVEFFNNKQKLGTVKYPTTPNEIKSMLLFKNCIWHPTVLLKKNAFDLNNLIYNQKFIYAQDYDLWSRAIFKIKMINIPEVLVFYRVHKNQITSSHSNLQKQLVKQVIKNTFTYLNYKISLKELDIHYSVSNLIFNNKNQKYHIDCKNWFKKILRINKLNSYPYDQKILMEQISTFYFLLCQHLAKKLKYKIWFSYYLTNFNYPSNLSSQQHYKFFLSCFPKLGSFISKIKLKQKNKYIVHQDSKNNL